MKNKPAWWLFGGILVVAAAISTYCVVYSLVEWAFLQK